MITKYILIQKEYHNKFYALQMPKNEDRKTFNTNGLLYDA